MNRAWRNAAESRRGSLLVPVLLFAVMLAGASAVYSTTVTTGHGVRMRELRELRLELAAEAGLADALASLRAGGSGVLGSAQQPIDLGGLTYYTELRNTGGDRWSLVSVGLKGRGRHALEAFLQVESTGVASAALFAFDRITLASNVAVDSYDPTLGDYASQVTTDGGGTSAGRNADVLTNGSLDLRASATIFGDAHWGSEAADTFTSSGRVSGEVAPLGSELSFEAPAPPAGASSGRLTVPARARTTLGPGTVILDDVAVEGRGHLELVGPAEVVMQSLELSSRATFSVDASGGPVTIFCLGDFALRSNATVEVEAEDATKVTLVLLAEQADEDDRTPPLEFRSNGTWIGRILAPFALVEISSNFEVFGAIHARWVSLASNTLLHYDERLAVVEEELTEPEWTVISTRRLSSAQLEQVQNAGSAP